MSNIRKHALAVATAVALSAIVAPASAGRVITTGLESGDYEGFIVKYRKGSEERADVGKAKAALMRAAKGKVAGKALALGHERRLGIGADLFKVDRKLDKVEAEALMAQIAADPNVEYVQPNSRAYPVMAPNDTSYNQQWGFSGANGIRAQTAWDRSTGQGVVVAVVDTGITAHTDLDANVLPGYDFISDAARARDGNARDNNPRDEGDWYAAGECQRQQGANSSFHGTHVAGTVAAVTNNASGVAGTAFNARVVPVRVLGKCGGTQADIADGIVWAAGGAVNGVPANANPAEVINMSLGGGGVCAAVYQDAINDAVGRGATVVVAAGNSNADAANFQPASCANVITVASIDSNGSRSWFSNYGANIDVAAPGGNIFSTINTGATVPAGQGYGNMSGTSMAAPHVAGVVALMQSAAAANPRTPAQIEALITGNTAAFPANPDQDIGPGLVDANAAVNAVLGVEPPPPANNALTKGVAKTNLSAATGAYAKFTMVVPAGATNLTFTMAGGTGDADMYVRFGAEPTDNTYDCRPYKDGNAETCTFAAPQAGTYYINLKAYSAFNGVSLTGDYTPAGGGGGGAQTYSNTADYAINDNATVDSPIVVANRAGNAPSNASVNVAIVHPYIGDLKVDLVAPDGTLYNIHNRTGQSTDNINRQVQLNLSTEALNGTWKLRVNDNANGDTGKIDSWSVTF